MEKDGKSQDKGCFHLFFYICKDRQKTEKSTQNWHAFASFLFRDTILTRIVYKDIEPHEFEITFLGTPTIL
jgi:hypothetical protein